jgi:hypothetical protein
MNAMTFKRLPRGWTLLLGFVLVLVVVGLTQRWRHRIQLYEDDNRSRESILRHVPRGTPMAQARSTLESGGFDCELSTGLRRGERTGLSALSCARSDWWGSGRWSVGLWLEGELVEDISVGFGRTWM